MCATTRFRLHGTFGILQALPACTTDHPAAVGIPPVATVGHRLCRQHREGLPRPERPAPPSAASIMASPAQQPPLQTGHRTTALARRRLLESRMFHLLIAVAVILTVIRHTRADEESSRAELCDFRRSQPVRQPESSINVFVGLPATSRCARRGRPAGLGASRRLGRWRWAPRWPATGLVFTAVAAVAAATVGQRPVRSRCRPFAVLATAFTLRADAGDAGSGTLSWLSPLGWSLQVRPYAGDRWWVLLLHLATTVLLTALAYRLARRSRCRRGSRQPRRPGPATATPFAAERFRVGVAAGSLHSAAVDRRAVPLRLADRQRRSRHGQRARWQRRRGTSSCAWVAPVR